MRDRFFRARNYAEQRRVLDAICNGAPVMQEEFAIDGLTQTAIREKDVNVLQPAYRSDILVSFPAAGVYCLVDEAADISATVSGGESSGPVTGRKDRRLLGFVEVSAGPGYPATAPPGQSPAWLHIFKKLLKANPGLPPQVRTDLAAMKTPEFAPVPDIPGSSTPTKGVSFFIGPVPAADPSLPAPSKPQPTPPPVPVEFAIENAAASAAPTANNTSTYDPSWIDYTAVVGTTDEWRLTTNGAAHIFHIHVNPFQIVDILTPAGQSIVDSTGHCTELDLKDANGHPAPDPQYCNMIGVVRDTIFLKGRPAGSAPGTPGYTVLMRTRYDRYIGEFVMHCHILDHEDRGMMANVLITNGASPLGSVALTGSSHQASMHGR